MLLSIDGTLLVQILNFVVFWMLLRVLFILPTRRAIEERLRIIASQRSDAEALRARASALRGEADSILDEARRRTGAIMREASERASSEAHAIERRASEEATASVQLAHTTVASERAKAVSNQGQFVKELAHAMAQRAIGNGEVA